MLFHLILKRARIYYPINVLDEAHEMLIKDENALLAVGMFSISLGIPIGRLLHFEYSGYEVSDLIEGVLVGFLKF